ncbi:hypothetical protein CBM2634_U170008 [Cupriavidus taiwanensis]|uniref:Uncharacterized protein n=1 Tax=Cupriavidus taiwanensis TaxID=164546 RepID=A0A375JBU6_9BURK|nr:hypothetical protein CBM2634_U170008 [Cupriavidus taiwanensis]
MNSSFACRIAGGIKVLPLVSLTEGQDTQRICWGARANLPMMIPN